MRSLEVRIGHLLVHVDLHVALHGRLYCGDGLARKRHRLEGKRHLSDQMSPWDAHSEDSTHTLAQPIDTALIRVFRGGSIDGGWLPQYRHDCTQSAGTVEFERKT
jgi:hypothetical protein